MFGYIRPDYGELKTKYVSLYRSVYCGICRCGGKNISHFTRLFLNYDFVFLAAVRLAVTKEKFKLTPRRCMFSFKKQPVMEPNSALLYTSAAFGALMYYKALDDLNDEKGFKRFGVKLTLPLFKRTAKKAEKLYCGLGDMLKAHLDTLSRLENQRCPSPDMAADSFAKLLGDISAFGLEGDKARVAWDIGYHTGRFVYLADAADDRFKDRKSGSYNPFNLCYGDFTETEENKEFILRTLKDSGAAISRAYALCDGSAFDDIIYNISSYGISAAADKVINKEKD